MNRLQKIESFLCPFLVQNRLINTVSSDHFKHSAMVITRQQWNQQYRQKEAKVAKGTKGRCILRGEQCEHSCRNCSVE